MIFDQKKHGGKHTDDGSPTDRFYHDFERWDTVVRELAEHDPRQFASILALPVREGLAMLEHKIRKHAEDSYRFSVLLYTLAAPHSKEIKMPDVPAILK